MPQFTIKAVHKVEDKPADGEYRAQKVFYFDLENGGEVKTARWYTSPDAAAPAVGSTIEGELEQKGYGWKFKKASKGGWGGGGRPKSPEELAADLARQRMIVRQHSQTTALRYAELRLMDGDLPPQFTFDKLKAAIDWFYNDAMSAAEES